MPNPLGGFAGVAARMAREGLSANKALARLKEAGLGIRRTDFLKAYSELKEAVNARHSLLGLPLAATPDESMVAHFDSDIATGYQHIVLVQSVNRLTNELVPRRISVMSDRRLTVEQAESLAFTRHLEENYEPDHTPISVSLEEVRHFGPGGE